MSCQFLIFSGCLFFVSQPRASKYCWLFQRVMLIYKEGNIVADELAPTMYNVFLINKIGGRPNAYTQTGIERIGATLHRYDHHSSLGRRASSHATKDHLQKKKISPNDSSVNQRM